MLTKNYIGGNKIKYKSRLNSLVEVFLSSLIMAAPASLWAALVFTLSKADVKNTPLVYVFVFVITFLCLFVMGAAVYLAGTLKNRSIIKKANKWYGLNPDAGGDIGTVSFRISEDDYVRANAVYCLRSTSRYMTDILVVLLCSETLYAMILDVIQHRSVNGIVIVLFLICLYFLYSFTVGIAVRSRRVYSNNKRIQSDWKITITGDSFTQSNNSWSGTSKKLYDVIADEKQLVFLTSKTNLICLNRKNFRDDAQFYYFVVKASGIC